ncbi:MAG: choice-of-anchor D domain-containing protein [Acidobacteriia bacterium]|nr:choice-of-anchor D domain-containing protein [Terriglobia bacterium]
MALAALLSLAGCAGLTGNPGPKTSGGGTPGTGSPVISVTPSPVSFGNVTVGSSAPQSMSVSNPGTADLTITNVVTSGTGFSISGLSVPLTVGVGQSHSFTASFQPASAGSASGSIAFTNNATSGAYLVNMSGTGAAAPSPSPHSVALSWTASTSSGVTGYNVYRSPVSGGPYAMVSPSRVAATQYTDSTVQSAQTYYYVITAVDSSNAESAYSNEASAAIP